MESGADNMVTSACPTSRSDCWVEADDANTLCSADVVVQVLREHRAFAEFLDAWAAEAKPPSSSSSWYSSSSSSSKASSSSAPSSSAPSSSSKALSSSAPSSLRAEAARHRAVAAAIGVALNRELWSEDASMFVARNASSGAAIPNAVYLLGVPLWGGPGAVIDMAIDPLDPDSDLDPTAAATTAAAAAAATAATAHGGQTHDDGGGQRRAAKIVERLWADDMMSDWGVRSTSSADPLYTNEDVIYPYSNWRGPVWVVAQAMLAYGLLDHGHTEVRTAKRRRRRQGGLAARNIVNYAYIGTYGKRKRALLSQSLPSDFESWTAYTSHRSHFCLVANQCTNDSIDRSIRRRWTWRDA